jgi:hypothetical protein
MVFLKAPNIKTPGEELMPTFDVSSQHKKKIRRLFQNIVIKKDIWREWGEVVR